MKLFCQLMSVVSGLVLTLAVPSCSDEARQPSVYLSGEEREFMVASQGDTVRLSFEAADVWLGYFQYAADTVSDWLYAEPTNGTAGHQTVTVRASENPAADSRQAEFCVQSHNDRIRYHFVQEGKFVSTNPDDQPADTTDSSVMPAMSACVARLIIEERDADNIVVEKIFLTLSYDSDNHIAEAVIDTESDGKSAHTELSVTERTSDGISYVVKQDDGTTAEMVCDVNDGHIVKGGNWRFRYNGNRLVKMENSQEAFNLYWADTNVGVVRKSDGSTIAMEYGRFTPDCNLYVNAIILWTLSGRQVQCLPLAETFNFGQAGEMLVERITGYGEASYLYLYESDDDGRLLRVLEHVGKGDAYRLLRIYDFKYRE